MATGETKRQIEADICIIGSGAAGLLMGHEFLGSDTRVVILESGNTEKAAVPDPLYDFTSEQQPISLESRVRALGGTTTVWSGRWKPLDPIDFDARDWIPNSGWPLTRSELLPYYRRADALVDVEYAYDDSSKITPPFSLERAEALEPTGVVFLEKHTRNWGNLFKADFNNSKNVSLYVDSHVTNIHKEGRRVVQVSGRTTTGSEFVVRASRFVLAIGGIENARLLLLSNIGNEHDQVGRYYMDHPKMAAGIIEGQTPINLSNSGFYDNPGETRFGLRLKESIQRSHKLLNAHILLESVQPNSFFAKVQRKLFAETQYISPTIRIRNYLEQPPRAENRVSLGQKRDAFGSRLASIAWSVRNEEMETLAAFHTLLSQDLERMGMGKLMSPLLSSPKGARDLMPTDASHHMGTTRMGVSPEYSVVDPSCCVHGTENLFIAGSSVFPTGGSANPTATIGALAIRLADHLKTTLAK